MGLFRSDKWECNSCGETYRSNPSKCSECGHTIFTQYRERDEKIEAVKNPQSESKTQKEIWYCGKCKQKHAEKPEECKVCGTEEFDKVERHPEKNSEDDQYTPPDDDVETISNVREATSSPFQPEGENSVPRVYFWILLFVVIAALVMFLL